MSCINCSYQLSDHDKFCPNCGNKVIQGKVTLKSLLGEFANRFLSFDSKFFVTVKDLTLRPEKVINAYLQHNRVKYLTPINFLIIGGIFGSFFSYLMINDYLGVVDYNSFDFSGAGQQKNNPLAKDFPETMKKVMILSQKYYSISLFATIPIIALVSKVVFFNYKQYNFAEHSILYSYSYANYLILSYLFIPFFLINDSYINKFSYLTFLTIFLYHIFVIKRFFGLTLKKLLLKTLLFVGVGLAIYMVFSLILAAVFIIYMIKTGQLENFTQ